MSCEIVHFPSTGSIGGPSGSDQAGLDPRSDRPAAGGSGRAVGGARGGVEEEVPVPGGALRCRTLGGGPPVLCLHGVSARGAVWRRVASRLADEFTLHVPDLLGRGASEARPDAGFRLADEIARAEALAARLPDRGYLVAGHSQGAALAVALAACAGREGAEGTAGSGHGAGAGAAPRETPPAGTTTEPRSPPRPAGLVLAAPVTPWTRRPAVLGALRFAAVRRALAPVLSVLRRPLTRRVLERRAFGDPARVDADAVRRYARPWSDASRARTLLRVLADWRPAELSGHLPADPPPARVLAGALDRRIRPREAWRWAGRLGAGFDVARDAGHLVPEERPGLVAAAVRRVAERAGLSG